MAIPSHDHQDIFIRNFLTLFVCISLVAYVHFELNQATSVTSHTNSIVNSILNNETYTIKQQQLYKLQQSLKSKQYSELSQAECLVRIYLDVLNNQKFLSETTQKVNVGEQEQTEQSDLNFTELIFPTNVHDLEGFKSCSDILTLMNFLNPTKTDFIYTNFMQQKYGSFITQEQTDSSKTELKNKQNGFCIISHQTNTSRTKLRANINSLIEQSYQNYRLVIVDNGSTDGSYEIAKVILQDLKQKLIKESLPLKQKFIQQELIKVQQKLRNEFFKQKFIQSELMKVQQKLLKDSSPLIQKIFQQKYQIIHEENKLGLWELMKKYDSKCQGMNYMLVIDGRDQLATRHVLNILNRKIISSKQAPGLITAPILKKKELARQSPASAINLNNTKLFPSFSFKAISIDIYNLLKQKIYEQTRETTHSFEIERTSLQIFIKYCLMNSKPILQIDEMLYVYDSIQNKQTDRNEYYLAIAKKDLEKNRKQQTNTQ